jgi:Ca2+/H+ antiporter
MKETNSEKPSADHQISQNGSYKNDNSQTQTPLEFANNHPQKSLWNIIKLPIWEYFLVALLLGATITMFVLHHQNPANNKFTIGVVVTSALLGIWLAFRPSEWAVDGLDNLMRYVGLTAYVAGVISSLASNLPEAVAAGIMIIKGSFGANPNPELVMTAFYTTLAAAGFNAILLGIVVIVGSKSKGYIQVKKETVQAEGVLLRWGFVATLMTFGIGIIEFIDSLFEELHGWEGTGGFFESESELMGELPRLAGITLVISYLIYIVFLIVKSKQAKIDSKLAEIPHRAQKPTRGKLDEKMPNRMGGTDEYSNEGLVGKELANESTGKATTEQNMEEELECPEETDNKKETNPYVEGPHLDIPHVSFTASIILIIIGVGGIAGGGYLLSHAVEIGLETTSLNVEIMALIVGFSGAIPEHGIAVVAAHQGKTDVALGNLLGGILQMTLLVFGAFACIVRAPINDFILFQIIAIAGIIWFIKRGFTDDMRISVFEGIMIIIAQLFSFLLLVGELTGITLF